MATNLLISFPDIPDEAISTTSSSVPDTDQSVLNLASGPRSIGFRLASTNTSLVITYDLGSASTKAIDHLIIAKGYYLRNGLVTAVEVDRSSNGSTWTNAYTDSSYSSATFRGPGSLDYAEEISTTSAYRYWRVEYTASTSNFWHSKIYLGQFFDIGKDPVDISVTRDTGAYSFTADDGTKWPAINRGPLYRLSLTWEGITDDDAESFLDRALDRNKRFCFLYAKDNTAALQGNKLLHCEIERDSVRVEKVFNNYNLVTARFLELRD